MAKDVKYGEIKIDRIHDENEPVVVFRAQDVLASHALRAYRDLMEAIGNKEGVASIELSIKRFEAWPYRRLPT
jgi:hypothetical protein